MGKLEEKISKDLKVSLKARQTARTSILRMVIASMENLRIEKKESELKDEDVVKILKKLVKQHLDSIENFKKGNREDLVEKETKELDLLKSYLPEELSPDEIKNIVKNVVKETGASSKSQFGMVMKKSMEELKGRADGKTVSSIIQELLK